MQFDILDFTVVIAAINPRTQMRVFLGNGFFVSKCGLVATCAHVIEKVPEGYQLIVARLDGSKPGKVIRDVKAHIHKTMDFALIETFSKSDSLEFHSEPMFMGDSVSVIGCLSDRDEPDKLATMMFSGNVVRRWEVPVLERTNSTCELSFPILSGLSGAVIVMTQEKSKIYGMAYGNKESAITTHKLVEVREDGRELTEKIDRVVELGCAHVVNDIKIFIRDLESSLTTKT